MTRIPGLVMTDVGTLLFAQCHQLPDSPPIDQATVSSLLQEAGYASWFPFEPALLALVERWNALEGEFELAIGERRDAGLKLEVSNDAMAAWVTLTPAFGGQAMTAPTLLAALNKEGVVAGLDEELLHQLCQQPTTQRVQVATGRGPENGADTRFELLVADTRDRRPKVNENGLVDFHELGPIPMVDAGQALMRRIPETPGIDGLDVRGQAVPAQAGHSEPFATNLTGVEIDSADPNLLCAACNGLPVHSGNGMSVEQVVKFSSINIATGNVTFDGTVTIDGDVMPGMKVCATGDITVTGTVDGGVLEAGGNIQVHGGIIAKAKVQAQGAVAARFAENVTIHAGTVINLDDMALHCELQALNQIMVGTQSPQRGRLVGGTARAMMLIQVPQLGASSGTVTQLTIGTNPVLEAQHSDLLQAIDKQGAEEEKLKKLVQYLGQKGVQTELLERAKTSWQHALQAWGALLQQRAELEQQLACTGTATVNVSAGVAGTTDIVFGKKTLHLRNELGPGVISMAEDRLVFTDASNTVRAAA